MLEDPDDPNVAIGKAEDELSAASMIKRLSGRRHQVWSATGVQICGDWTFFVESAVVQIDELTVDEIAHLIESGSGKGKQVYDRLAKWENMPDWLMVTNLQSWDLHLVHYDYSISLL